MAEISGMELLVRVLRDRFAQAVADVGEVDLVLLDDTKEKP